MRVAILGNSGSGKSTLARWWAATAGLAVLDLDTVAWAPDEPAVARPDALAVADVERFCGGHAGWVVEGCYAHLIEATLRFEPLLIFLNPGVEACLAHCHARPWEPHKYATPAQQDANLPFLLSWVAQYAQRQGPTSLAAHAAVFAGYAGRKVQLDRVPRLTPPEDEVLAWLR